MITNQNKFELKPCPFCGSTNLDVTQWIECNGCGAFGPTPTDSGDLSEWNTRVDTALTEELRLARRKLRAQASINRSAESIRKDAGSKL